MFHQLIQHKRDEWFASPDCTVGDVVAYIVRRGMMRDAQIEAIKTYLYLKIACGNKPRWQLSPSSSLIQHKTKKSDKTDEP